MHTGQELKGVLQNCRSRLIAYIRIFRKLDHMVLAFDNK